MDVDHFEPGEYIGRDNPAVGDDDPDLRSVAKATLRRVLDGNGEPVRQSFNGGRRRRATTRPALVGSCYDHCDVVPGPKDLGENDRSRFRRAQKGDSQRSGLVELASTAQLFHSLLLLVLVEKAQQKPTVEMVHLVLEASRLKLVGFYGDLPTVEVVASQVDLLGSHDREEQSRNGQAPLVVLPLAALIGDRRIYDRDRLGVAELVDEHPLLDAHLRSCQTQTVSGMHRLQHRLGEAGEPAVHVGYFLGRLGEDWVAEEPDRIRRHGYMVAPARPNWPERRKAALFCEPCVMPHYFDEVPGVASRPGTVLLRLADFDAELVSDRGVFSAARLDPGTAVLLDAGVSTASERDLEGNLLDLGCGYGPVACTVAHRNPRATVWALDVNRRALELTGRNALRLGLTNVVTATPEEIPQDVAFEGIWSNPPIRIGKTALQELLSAWLDRLAGAGTARLVVARNLGADSLAGWLAEQGFRVDRYASKRGYRLLAVRRGGSPGAGDAS